MPFNTPVDTAVYTAYLDYIETPMDFSAVRRKCESGAYGGPDNFAGDMRLVFANARSYNKVGTDVFVMATTLEVRWTLGRGQSGSEPYRWRPQAVRSGVSIHTIVSGELKG